MASLVTCIADNFLIFIGSKSVFNQVEIILNDLRILVQLFHHQEIYGHGLAAVVHLISRRGVFDLCLSQQLCHHQADLMFTSSLFP